MKEEIIHIPISEITVTYLRNTLQDYDQYLEMMRKVFSLEEHTYGWHIKELCKKILKTTDVSDTERIYSTRGLIIMAGVLIRQAEQDTASTLGINFPYYENPCLKLPPGTDVMDAIESQSLKGLLEAEANKQYNPKLVDLFYASVSEAVRIYLMNPWCHTKLVKYEF